MILTENGERVRYKIREDSGRFIFYRQNILYKYEKPLYLKGYGTVYPDFYIFCLQKQGKRYIGNMRG